MQLPVAPWEAVLGSSVQIDTLAGTFNLKIPENSHTGTKLKLKGKGLGRQTTRGFIGAACGNHSQAA